MTIKLVDQSHWQRHNSTGHISLCFGICTNNVPYLVWFQRYSTLNNGVPLKSRSGVTHSVNLCKIYTLLTCTDAWLHFCH